MFQLTMLSAIRTLARPLSTVALLLFVAPGAVVQCGEISAVAGGVMACCKPSSDGAGLKSNCCVVDDANPASEGPSSTTGPERSSSHALVTVDVQPALGVPVPSRDGTVTGRPGLAPPDRLYIRYAAIRR